jgi:hypothetical protein
MWTSCFLLRVGCASVTLISCKLSVYQLHWSLASWACTSYIHLLQVGRAPVTFISCKLAAYQLHSHVGFFRIDIGGNQCGAKQARSKLCFPLPRFVCIPWQPIQMCNCPLIGVRALPDSHIRSRRKNHSLPRLVNLNVILNFWQNFQVYSLGFSFGKKVANANMIMTQMQPRHYN